MRPAVVTVAQQKGGAGKTTLVIQLATALTGMGRKVALVDIDPQGSLTGWMRMREHRQRDAAELRFSMIGGWRLGVELDIWASKATVDHAAKERRRVAMVLNRVPPRGRSIEEARGEIMKLGAEALGTQLGNRQAFVSSVAQGLGVIESEPKSAAAEEVRALALDVMRRLG